MAKQNRYEYSFRSRCECECDEKNFEDFAIMGAALHNALYPLFEAKVALLNIGSEEIKGHETIKKAYHAIENKKNQSL